MEEYTFYLNFFEEILGDGITTSTELDNVGSLFLSSGFKGVFAFDRQPQIKNNESYIVNTDNHDESGTHWLSVVKHANKYYCYDSFGRSAKSLGFKLHFKNTELDQEQSIVEENCGCRCLAVLYVYENHGIDKFLSI